MLDSEEFTSLSARNQRIMENRWGGAYANALASQAMLVEIKLRGVVTFM